MQGNHHIKIISSRYCVNEVCVCARARVCACVHVCVYHSSYITSKSCIFFYTGLGNGDDSVTVMKVLQLIYTHTYIHHACAHTHAHTHTHTRACTPHTHARAHTHTHTHTHTLNVLLLLPNYKPGDHAHAPPTDVSAESPLYRPFIY